MLRSRQSPIGPQQLGSALPAGHGTHCSRTRRSSFFVISRLHWASGGAIAALPQRGGAGRGEPGGAEPNPTNKHSERSCLICVARLGVPGAPGPGARGASGPARLAAYSSKAITGNLDLQLQEHTFLKSLDTGNTTAAKCFPPESIFSTRKQRE